MDILVLFLPGLLSFCIVNSEVLITKDMNLRMMLGMIRNLIILIYMNIIGYIVAFRLLFRTQASFINGSLNPEILSLKGLVIILLTSVFIGYTIKYYCQTIKISLSSEKPSILENSNGE